ncbi:DUF1998 domain-containing protein [Pseudanabaena sp. FACHB-1277]|uniref:DUF1998 domain-containing protein n=1 Tax=Pseudanabaena cinerea FACHB-1277 TaxID=2949581 RepID=A0A926Z694_9CYAN|nr:DUF1998 domain-containing protein [Pseudanabaena cinerea]MBD2150425.1 DUF1998 domain-containing protein [Pseudanabaena cinerea FACHB-1277]
MNPKKKIPPAGEIRQSQIITTFGAGSMVDLPNKSVIIGGLNHWTEKDCKTIKEERLAQYVQKVLGVASIQLKTPPIDEEEIGDRRIGITAFTFPHWFLAQVDQTIEIHGKKYRTRPLIPWGQLVKGKYLNEDRKSIAVVPVRFVQACPNGHISDINWHGFVRHELSCTNKTGRLWFDEGTASNDFSEIYVRCDRCYARRQLKDATIPNARNLGYCEGHRPWLGLDAITQEQCVSLKEHSQGNPEANRLLVRSASNAYFAQVVSAISIPDSDEKLRTAVDEIYEDFLQYAEDVDDIKRDRRKQKVANALEGFNDEIVWQEVQRRKSDQSVADKSLKQLEIETLLAQPEGDIDGDLPDSDFYARARNLDQLAPIYQEIFGDCIDRIVLVHRLREVVAQVGFTRFEPTLITTDGELDLGVNLAPLGLETDWVPAYENRGEGVFISFKPEAIATWLQKTTVKKRGQELLLGYDKWKKHKGIKSDWLPSLPYIMLHSLSHLLITAISLECGYSASAIRERIYASEAGYGILLHTGSSGSEGTLGGLIEVGKQIERYLKTALEMGHLCSNDPVCSQHKPADSQEDRYLHGAACHGCLLIAETSCERRNELLDRALVVRTVDAIGAEFFLDLTTL